MGFVELNDWHSNSHMVWADNLMGSVPTRCATAVPSSNPDSRTFPDPAVSSDLSYCNNGENYKNKSLKKL